MVGITPNNIKNQMIMIPKPEITNPFLVPHKFFSNQAILQNNSAKYPEKKTIDQPIHAITNPIMICLAIVFIEIIK